MGKIRIPVALVLLLAACGGISGGMSCTKTSSLTSGHALCSGALDQVSGSKALSFDLRDAAVGNSIGVKITVTVKSGAVTVSFLNAQGQTVSKDASGSQPLTLENTIGVDLNGNARITLDSAYGISMNVQYTAEFTR